MDKIEVINKDDIKITYLIEKCRCCFGEIDGNENFIEIDNSIKQKFFTLCNLEVS